MSPNLGIKISLASLPTLVISKLNDSLLPVKILPEGSLILSIVPGMLVIPATLATVTSTVFDSVVYCLPPSSSYEPVAVFRILVPASVPAENTGRENWKRLAASKAAPIKTE